MSKVSCEVWNVLGNYRLVGDLEICDIMERSLVCELLLKVCVALTVVIELLIQITNLFSLSQQLRNHPQNEADYQSDQSE